MGGLRRHKRTDGSYEWSDKTQDELERLDGERPVQGG